MNKFIKLSAIITSLILTLSLVGCSNNKTTNSNDDTLITMILDVGGINDESFNQLSWEGAQKASKDLGVTVKYLESTSDSDYAQNIETAVDMDSDLIIGIGFKLSDAIKAAAENYPEQSFAIIDGDFDTIPSNVTPLSFDEFQAGYLTGLAAAKTIKSDKFGFIGGMEVPAVTNYKNGFEKGLKEINPNAELSVQYANSFTDAAKGRVITEQMYNAGAMAVMSAAGGVNNGAYEVATEKGIYAIAVDMAQSYVSPDTILTSAIKKVDVGVKDVIKKYIDGSLKGGNNLNYSISNDGVDYEKTTLLSNEAIEYVESIKDTYKK